MLVYQLLDKQNNLKK